MGFDLNGLKAKSEKGEYFRNNVWWWRPLAEYVLDNVDIPEEEKQYWGSNDGQRVSAKTALRIADTLDKLIEEGYTAQYEKDHKAELESLPLERCEHCNGTGTRNDEYVQGKCNACDGKGKRESWAAQYPFSVENVKEFSEFCRESGGFEIY